MHTDGNRRIWKVVKLAKKTVVTDKQIIAREKSRAESGKHCGVSFNEMMKEFM